MTPSSSSVEDFVKNHQNDDTDIEAQAPEPLEKLPTRHEDAEEDSSSSDGEELAQLGRLPTAKLEWESEHDVDNPRNWPAWKRVFHTAIPAIYGFIITVGTSVYVPAIPHIMAIFHVDRVTASLPLSLYTFGFVVGPIFASPLSELYGRRIIYWASLPLLVIFTGVAGASNNITQLILTRFFAGFFGSGALAVGAGTIADIWSDKSRGRASLFYIMAPFLGPALGPLTGAYIIAEYNNNWRWSMWVVIIIASPILVGTFFMKETSKHRILHSRRKASGDKLEHQAGDTKLLILKLQKAIGRPLHMMIFEPTVALLSIYTGFAFAMMFSFFGSYNYVFQSVYHFNQKEIGLTFLGILVGFFCAVATFSVFDVTIYKKEAAKVGGKPAPEHRLYAAMVGSVMLPIGLFWFAWSPSKSVHWIVPVLAGVPFGWGTLAIFISVTTYLVDVYQAHNGASAVAANGILRYLLGAVFPLFTVQMYEAMGIHWAGSVFAFVGLALMPVPWVFYFKGSSVRSRSVYDTFKG
ncbi:putative polyamine transporter 4 [Tricladium varicosporioides]|nr:putative polyamine transporter 4 [Hymenoscyphus varicosporioides]